MSRGRTPSSTENWNIISTSALSYFCQWLVWVCARAVMPWRPPLKPTSWIFCHDLNPNTYWPNYGDSWQQSENRRHRKKKNKQKAVFLEKDVYREIRCFQLFFLTCPKMLACSSGSTSCLMNAGKVQLLSFPHRFVVFLLHVRWNAAVQSSFVAAVRAGRSFSIVFFHPGRVKRSV